MRDNGSGFFLIIIMIILFGVMDDDTDKEKCPDVTDKAVIAEAIPEPKVLIDYIWPDGMRRILREGDKVTVKFQINYVHGGYVGTGPATESVYLEKKYTLPNRYYMKNNGLFESSVKFVSSFGQEYTLYTFNRRMLDTAIIRDKDGEGELYLAQTAWLDEKTLTVVVNQTSHYELKQLDKAMFGPKGI